MMYLYLLKKEKGDVAPSPVVVGLVSYARRFDKCFNTVWICPGYMSKTDWTIQNLCSFFKKCFSDKTLVLCSGMNGNVALKSGNTILKEHQRKLSPWLLLNFPGKDHSKTIFFLDIKKELIHSQDDLKDMQDIRKSNEKTWEDMNNQEKIQAMISYLETDKICVTAAMIGSSNFSYQTYLNGPADKGECDVLIISEMQDGDTEALAFYDELNSREYMNGLRPDLSSYELRISLSKEIKSNYCLNRMFLDYLKSQSSSLS